eukprot:gene30356-39586_t
MIGKYDLAGKFLSSSNPRKSAFPKGGFVRDKSQLTPGPGSYKPMESMGKQVLSTCEMALILKRRVTNAFSAVLCCGVAGTSHIGPGDYKPRATRRGFLGGWGLLIEERAVS